MRFELRKVLRWFTRSTRIWATLYIILIPVVGSIYYLLPAGSFFDANITREPGYKQDLTAVANFISCAAQNQESNYEGDEGSGPRSPFPPTYTFQGAIYAIAPDTINVPASSITVDSSGNITLTIQGNAQEHLGLVNESRSSCSSSSFFNFGDEVTIANDGITTSIENGKYSYGYTVSFSAATDHTGQPPLNALLPYMSPAMGGSVQLNPNSSFLWLSPSASRAVQRLSSEGEGDPKYAPGLLLRMWYFSATTVTTLGFGDITPVTSPARTIVGLEAISGVVLIGLFLNALARKSDKHSD
jgi:Ion channel